MATITSYDSLLDTFGQYVDRADLQGYMPNFVQMAESRFNRLLRTRDMEVASANAVDGAATFALPADYLEWIAAYWTPANGDGPGRRLGLRYVEGDSPEARYRHRPSGDPQYFTILAGQINLVPARAGSCSFIYYQKIPALGPSQQTNWLITRAPELYLYAVLSEAMAFQRDEARATEWMKMAEERLQAFLSEGDSQKVARRADRRAITDAAEVTAKNLPV